MRQSTIGDASTVKKQTIAHSTFEKWKHDFDREFKTIMDCKSTIEGEAKVVAKLKCTVCNKLISLQHTVQAQLYR